MILVHMPTLLVVALFFTGCSTVSPKRLPNFATTEARLDAASAVANPEAKFHIEEARKQLESAKQACFVNTEALEQAVKERNEAVKDAEVWKAKQRKALGELWMWRGALIAAILFAARGPILWVVRKFIGIPW